MLSLGMLATRLIAVLTLALGLFGAGWRAGSSGIQAAWNAERNAQAVADARRAVRVADASVVVMDQYTRSAAATATRTQKLQEMAHVQFRSSSPPAGGACLLQPGIVRLHDAAATGADIEQAPASADAPGTATSLDQLIDAVVDNYGACQQNAAQLTALQAWVGAAAAPE